MSEARINRISNEKGDGGPSLSGITTFSGLNYFVPPKGTTAERPSDCPPGSIRFNTDGAHLEYFDGLQWLEFEGTNNELGGGTGSNTGLGNRGVWEGGSTSTPVGDTIDYVTISTLGDAQDFGNLSSARQVSKNACASSTRGVFGGGYSGSGYAGANVIDYITFSSTGNAADFGDLTQATVSTSAASNSTRGIFYAGGFSPSPPYVANVISYITIAQTGNAVDFGDALVAGAEYAGCSSSTRGLFAAANPTGIDYITIATLGNSLDFGSLAGVNNSFGACSNATRALFAGGYYGNSINYVTIASTGNAQDFGDLTVTKQRTAGCSSSTRGLFGGGGLTPSPSTNIIDYITISSTGNAQDFGDLTVARSLLGSCSNGHGGL